MECISFCSSMDSHMHILVTSHPKNLLCTSCHVLLLQVREQNRVSKTESVAGKATPDFRELFGVIPPIRAGTSFGGYQLIRSASFLLLRN